MDSTTFLRREMLAQYGPGLLLVPFCAFFALGADDYESTGVLGLLVHSLNLLPHEAGHFFFRFFGEFMMFAGGSLLQLMLPAIIAWSCFVHNQRIGTQLALFWLGQNFIDVSIYAADAQARELPLLGGLGPENHDWYNMLSMTGMLEYTPVIASLIFFLAFPCWIAMLVVPKWVW